MRGDDKLNLTGVTQISLISGTIEFGGANINQVNLQVKGNSNPSAVQLRQSLAAAQDAATAKRLARNALKNVRKEAKTRHKQVMDIHNTLRKKARKRKKKR